VADAGDNTHLLGLVENIRRYAAAHDITAADAGREIWPHLTNEPLPDSVSAPDRSKPKERSDSPWLAMSRRKLEELRRINQRRMAETAPSSDTAAVRAYLERERAEISAALAQKMPLPAPLRELLTEAMMTRHFHHGGRSAIETTVWWMRAAARVLEPLAATLQVPWPFDHVNATCHALEAAMGNNMGPLEQLLSARDAPAGHPIGSSTEDDRTALIAGGVAGLALGGEKAGGMKNPTLAGKAMHSLLADAGFVCGEQTPRQYHSALGKIAAKPATRRSQRERDLLARYQEVETAARNHLKAGPWLVAARLPWAALIAARAATL
jgi:hypothetical protein